MRRGTLVTAFIRTAGMQRRRGRSYFNAVDISPGQPRILGYLEEHDGCIQRELATNCNLEPASVTSVLGIMEAKGLITRASVPGDKRVQKVWLTDSGRRQCAACDVVFDQLDSELFAGFTPQERQNLQTYLQRIYENMKDAEKPAKKPGGQ